MAAAAAYNVTLDVAARLTQNAIIYEYFGFIPEKVRWGLMVLGITFGTVVNVTFLVCFLVEETLLKFSNMYLACTGMADLIITTVVFVMRAHSMMSSDRDTFVVCRSTQAIAQTAIYTESFFLMLVAYENLLSVQGRLRRCKMYVKPGYAYMALVMFMVFFGLAAYGVLNEYDYDYCHQKQEYENYIYRLCMVGILNGIPAIVTLYLYVATFLVIRHRIPRALRRITNYYRECSIVFCNLASYLMFVILWLPHLIVIITQASDENYHYTAWLGLSRSIFVNLVYPVGHITFRNAFEIIYKNCCCYSTLYRCSVRREVTTSSYSSYAEDPRIVEEIEMHPIERSASQLESSL